MQENEREANNMNFKSKKAITLVEMIVSLAIIGLVSITLLGLIVPAVNQQSLAEIRNIGVNTAAQQLENRVYNYLTPGSKDYSKDSGFISPEPYTFNLKINGARVIE